MQISAKIKEEMKTNTQKEGEREREKRSYLHGCLTDLLVDTPTCEKNRKKEE